MTITKASERQHDFFNTNRTKEVKYRKNALITLLNTIRSHESAVLDALYADLGKSRAESYMTEISIVYAELADAIKHTKARSRPKRARGVLSVFPSSSYVYSEPYGAVLILAPWNYPFNLAMTPLIGAIAAGNCAIVKCSKSSVNTARVIQEIINSAFPAEYLYCADADADYDDILNQKYDFIFFTGSPRVGKTIMRSAAENLTPVALELGGKSPCIIEKSADLKLAAKRIAWGKFLNSGQTCVSVDYIVIDESIKERFIMLLQSEIEARYLHAENSDAYPRIVNKHHYDRLCALIGGSEKAVIGGSRNETSLKIAPAIMPNADFDSEVMKEEIFGPILPIIGYSDLQEAVAEIKARERPLACYIFTGNKKTAESLIGQISYGGGCVNDAVLHIANHHIPFGGVGNSGMGAYHGKYSFDTFSHKKGVLKSSAVFDTGARYAPFDEKKFSFLKRLLK